MTPTPRARPQATRTAWTLWVLLACLSSCDGTAIYDTADTANHADEGEGGDEGDDGSEVCDRSPELPRALERCPRDHEVSVTELRGADTTSLQDAVLDPSGERVALLYVRSLGAGAAVAQAKLEVFDAGGTMLWQWQSEASAAFEHERGGVVALADGSFAVVLTPQPSLNETTVLWVQRFAADGREFAPVAHDKSVTNGEFSLQAVLGYGAAGIAVVGTTRWERLLVDLGADGRAEGRYELPPDGDESRNVVALATGGWGWVAQSREPDDGALLIGAFGVPGIEDWSQVSLASPPFVDLEQLHLAATHSGELVIYSSNEGGCRELMAERRGRTGQRVWERREVQTHHQNPGCLAFGADDRGHWLSVDQEDEGGDPTYRRLDHQGQLLSACAMPSLADIATKQVVVRDDHLVALSFDSGWRPTRLFHIPLH